MKWTKQSNIDIIHCYLNTILRIPNQPHRRDFHARWATLHPQNPVTEQRICDQQGVIMKKTKTQENIRGAWITRLEIHQMRNDVSREIENDRNSQQNELNNADVAIEGEHADLPHNIILPEENAIEQPNDIIENELLKIKKTLNNAYAESIVTPFDKRFNLRKLGRKTVKKLENFLKKVGIGNCIFNMNRRINELCADISKISQMNDPRPSPKMKRNTNSMKTKYQIVDEQTRSTSLETLKQRLYALNNRLSRY